MKKSLILISFLVLILSLSSCNKDKTENDIDKDKTEQIDIDKGKAVDEVSIKLEDKTIKLNNKMEGKELYQTLFQGLVGRDIGSFIYFDQGQGRSVRPCQAIFEEDLNQKYKNATSYESDKVALINGEDQSAKTTVYNNYILDIKEDSSEVKVFLEKTIDQRENVKGIKEENHSKTTVFGEQTNILPTDDDYNPEYTLRQYKDIVYYSSNEPNMPQNGIYEKNYTCLLDYVDSKISTEKYFRDACFSLLKNDEAPSIKTKFNSNIYNCDEWIDDYLQYEYELTDQYIILNYRALFDIFGVFEQYEESVTVVRDLKELVEEDNKKGSYYEVIAYIDYHNETFAQNGFILCDYLVEDWYRVKISKGTYDERYYPQFVGTEYDIYSKYQRKYTWKPLDITEAEIEKKKTELIDSLK